MLYADPLLMLTFSFKIRLTKRASSCSIIALSQEWANILSQEAWFSMSITEIKKSRQFLTKRASSYSIVALSRKWSSSVFYTTL